MHVCISFGVELEMWGSLSWETSCQDDYYTGGFHPRCRVFRTSKNAGQVCVCIYIYMCAYSNMLFTGVFVSTYVYKDTCVSEETDILMPL